MPGDSLMTILWFLVDAAL